MNGFNHFDAQGKAIMVDVTDKAATHRVAEARGDFQLFPEEGKVEAVCTVKVTGNTGVEMEALTGVSAALLTIYDMCKAVDRAMTLTNIRLMRKEGGKSGVFVREE